MDRRTLLLSALALPLLSAASRATPAAPEPGNDHIGMLIYPGFTALDFVGPHHFLGNLPGAQVHVVTTADDLSPVTSDLGLVVQPTTTMADCLADLTVLFMPGGTKGTIDTASDERVLEFVADRASRAKYVTSVCTGSLILGAAGVLQGKRATSHWVTVPVLGRFGAVPVRERVVRDGNVITGAGVSAGIDFGITLAEELRGRLFAEAGVLISEYAPEPPIIGGTLETARPEVAALLEQSLAPFVAEAQRLEMLR
ncbi:DJ-1/PfpI family protein [Devosia sp. SD17-2]|uniref:DJ-1/PfpI family protein n=1 Tax=Devosia sp. SD17-2 TaxID=2976459 RepID=UPI0023D7CB10|nr:DJ-1/PfpI family protein [Devosia sp. SD17-2]WEJ35080.1 DJ-1/PfpI family protein [Devosia sp. SD17-2]